ncbi:hypothetical protein HNP37_002509 [Flavobacterium nitrogenifigens]|uniref:Uncharacterized protein n=2 Tax=Flavobacterium TaxID=237 RepID=A0A7W7IXI1_9FLAO|nr:MULTISPECIES: hypothetical protein [Flavobacterium]MBB4802436.1 hypothetical protein [Flavobacterium nitrogenifigens]MBB6387394.1 hypothetical protein [Flavobacterium notoginsengisoli]
MKKPLNTVFLTYASDILANSEYGLTGTELGKFFSAKSIDHNVEIPFHKPPFIGVPNKRSAFFENLIKFNDEQRFEIITELLDHERLAQEINVKELKNKLYTNYPENIPEKKNILKSDLIVETQHWLSKYEKAFNLYNSSLEKLNSKKYQRNLIDDMRLSLEVLLKEILQNNASLENQLGNVGNYQETKGLSKESTNMFRTLLDYYTKYQNRYIKHDDNVNEKEIEFIIDLTSTFMKFIIKE